jgi:hypothetical protein
MGIIAMIRLFLSVGRPPAIQYEPEFRAWCRRLAGALTKMAQGTTSTSDDKVAAALVTLVETDAYWQIFFVLLRTAMDYLGEADQQAVGSSDEAQALANEAGVDPVTILALISLIIDLVSKWRNR